MEIKEMDHNEYCGLNRPLFMIDPNEDPDCYFGNQAVSDNLWKRIRTDLVVRGVPKCGVVGRWGGGKTHTLLHLKYKFECDPKSEVICFLLQLEPYDEKGPEGGGWKYIHGKLVNAMGESFIRDMMKEFDKKSEDRTADLSEQLTEFFKFGDNNLKKSLANVLAGYFLRSTRSTIPAWQWLRGDKVEKGTATDLGTLKALVGAEDMVNTIMNLGMLVRYTMNKGIVFLMDEAHGLDNVDARIREIHFAFRELAGVGNKDIGFIIAYMGEGGQASIPDVLKSPDDIVNRLGATLQNVDALFIDLGELLISEEGIKDFAIEFLKAIHDEEKAKQVINEFGLSPQGVTWWSLPFTEDAIDKFTKMLWSNEMWRSPRMIILEAQRIAAEVYNEGKNTNQYVTADSDYVSSALETLG